MGRSSGWWPERRGEQLLPCTSRRGHEYDRRQRTALVVQETAGEGSALPPAGHPICDLRWSTRPVNSDAKLRSITER